MHIIRKDAVGSALRRMISCIAFDGVVWRLVLRTVRTVLRLVGMKFAGRLLRVLRISGYCTKAVAAAVVMLSMIMNYFRSTFAR